MGENVRSRCRAFAADVLTQRPTNANLPCRAHGHTQAHESEHALLHRPGLCVNVKPKKHKGKRIRPAVVKSPGQRHTKSSSIFGTKDLCCILFT